MVAQQAARESIAPEDVPQLARMVREQLADLDEIAAIDVDGLAVPGVVDPRWC